MKENIFGMKHFDFVNCIILLSLRHEIQRGR